MASRRPQAGASHRLFVTVCPLDLWWMLPSVWVFALKHEERVQKAFLVDHHGPEDARLSHSAKPSLPRGMRLCDVCDTGGDAALTQLAEYLYTAECADAALLLGGTTCDGEGAALMPESNPKGRLLELYPETTITHVGSSDSALVWTTTATLHGVTTSAEGALVEQ